MILPLPIEPHINHNPVVGQVKVWSKAAWLQATLVVQKQRRCAPALPPIAVPTTTLWAVWSKASLGVRTGREGGLFIERDPNK